jgi:hypothetical protein
LLLSGLTLSQVATHAVARDSYFLGDPLSPPPIRRSSRMRDTISGSNIGTTIAPDFSSSVLSIGYPVPDGGQF